MKWECAIIEKFSTGILIGFSYYPKIDEKDYDEINIYCILFAIHIKLYTNEK